MKDRSEKIIKHVHLDTVFLCVFSDGTYFFHTLQIYIY